MDLLIYNPEHAEEIKSLFRTVFSNSEGESEGILIGNLAYELIVIHHNIVDKRSTLTTERTIKTS